VCFADYVQWFCSNVTDGWEEHDLVRVLQDEEASTLADLESKLTASRQILSVTEFEFATLFSFKDDLLTNDPGKIHDLLGEALFVMDLAGLGFTSISRLAPGRAGGRNAQMGSDFTAVCADRKFAVEVKTIRVEAWAKPGVLIGDGTQAAWWRKMYRQNAKTKIEDKSQRVIKQLRSTALQHHCDHTLLAINSRRLGPATFMSKADYIEELRALGLLYPEIGYFVSKDYYARHIVVYPDLPVSTNQ
jgi:hypothetical protein